MRVGGVGTWQAAPVDLIRELAVREALFLHLDEQLARSPDRTLKWDRTARFEFQGEQFSIRQTRGRGINKPHNLDAALTITTAFTKFGQEPPYADQIGPDGYPRYKYQRGDVELAANRSLRLCLEFELPVAYFVGVDRGFYGVQYPVYLLADDPQNAEFTLGFNRSDVGLDLSSLSPADRRYATRETKIRLHQPIFRRRVLHAYESSCGVCQLRHVELLDAAHIIGDAFQNGDPVVPNGIALCKIHHAAYDRNLLGIKANYEIVINERLLQETDGPMLKHGLQEMNGRQLVVPRAHHARPDPERLEVRFGDFENAS